MKSMINIKIEGSSKEFNTVSKKIQQSLDNVQTSATIKIQCPMEIRTLDIGKGTINCLKGGEL